MKTPFTIIAAVAAIAAIAVFAFFAVATESPWTDDYETAKVRAKSENKVIFAYFTASDRCPWCIRMQKEVLEKKEFLDYAKDHLVLLELDYPKDEENRAKQSAELKAQNKALDEKFKITAYPTAYLIDAEGEMLAGGEDFAVRKYLDDGPAGFAGHLKSHLAGKSGS